MPRLIGPGVGSPVGWRLLHPNFSAAIGKYFRHIAFGASEHRCLGSHLARLEVRVALEAWLDRYPDFSLADPGARRRIHARIADRICTDEPLPDFGRPVFLPSIDGTDTAFIQYTSGTTGLAKGIVHAHRYILGHEEFLYCHELRDGERFHGMGEWAWAAGSGSRAASSRTKRCAARSIPRSWSGARSC